MQCLSVQFVTIASHIPHHFSSRLDFMNTDFRSVSLFRKTNQSDLTIAQDIVTFFEQATPIHYSLIVTGFCLMMLFLILLFRICYLKIPQCLTRLLCCFDNTCCLKKRAMARQTDNLSKWLKWTSSRFADPNFSYSGNVHLCATNTYNAKKPSIRSPIT